MIRSEFSLDADLKSMRAVRSWVESSCNVAVVYDDVASRIVLILEELITNVTKYNPKSRVSLQLALTLGDAAIELVVEDDGEPFDVTVPPGMLPGEREFRVGGYGLQLVRQLMDEVVYSRDGGRNRLAFRKAL